MEDLTKGKNDVRRRLLDPVLSTSGMMRWRFLARDILFVVGFFAYKNITHSVRLYIYIK